MTHAQDYAIRCTDRALLQRFQDEIEKIGIRENDWWPDDPRPIQSLVIYRLDHYEPYLHAAQEEAGEIGIDLTPDNFDSTLQTIIAAKAGKK